MAQIEFPKLPGLKTGTRTYKGKSYYYIQTYTHHYDKVKKRQVRDSQKTVGSIVGNNRYGEICFKKEFLEQYPELENFIVYKTQNGIEYKAKPTDDDEVYLQAIAETKIQKLHGGANYAINKAMGELCIGEALKTVFNQYRRHLKLASLVHYMILKQTPVMHYYEPFAKTHFMPWCRPLNDSQISSLLKHIEYDDIMSFFVAQNRLLYKKYGPDFFKGLFVALDSTSISTYSNTLSHAEYGYNKDGDTTKQINCLMVCNQVTGIPIYIKTYKGNVVDISTVQNLMADLNILFSKVSKGNMEDFCPDITFVTDRGYDSNDNLLNFILNGFGFVMRSKLNTKWVRDIAIEALKDIHNDNNYNEFSKQYMLTKEVEYKYDPYPVNGKYKKCSASKKVYVHVYFDDKINTLKRDALRFNINVARELFKEKVDQIAKEKKSPVSIEEKTAINIGSMQSFIDKYCIFDSNGELKIDSQKVDEKVQLSGVMVLLSDTVATGDYAYFAYDRRRTVENGFQIFKSTLNFNRPYASNDNVFQGKLLCQYMALSVMSYFAHNIKKYEKSRAALKDNIRLNNYSLCRVLEELDTIMITKFKGGVYFDEVAGKYVHLYNSIGIPCPQSLYRYDIEDNNDTDDEEPYETELEDNEFKQFGGEEL